MWDQIYEKEVKLQRVWAEWNPQTEQSLQRGAIFVWEQQKIEKYIEHFCYDVAWRARGWPQFWGKESRLKSSSTVLFAVGQFPEKYWLLKWAISSLSGFIMPWLAEYHPLFFYSQPAIPAFPLEGFSLIFTTLLEKAYNLG